MYLINSRLLLVYSVCVSVFDNGWCIIPLNALPHVSTSCCRARYVTLLAFILCRSCIVSLFFIEFLL